MLLSASELFFVGLIRGFLSVEPFESVPEELTCDWPPDEDPWSACKQILEYANACGLGDIPSPEFVEKDLPDVDVSTIQWIHDEKTLSSEEVAVAQERLRRATAEARRDLQERDPSGAVGSRFEELLAETTPLLKGYSPQTPQFIYGLDAAGDIKVFSQTRLIQQGTLRTVLRKLAWYLDVPGRIYQALDFPHDENRRWWDRWAETTYSALEPVNQLDRAQAIEVIDSEFIGDSNHDKPFLLGTRLGRAGQLLRELVDWLCVEIQHLERFNRVAETLDFVPADRDLYQSDPDLADPPNFDELPDDPSGDGHEWRIKVLELARRARVQVALLGGVKDPNLETFCKPALKQLLKQLEDCQGIAKDLALDSVQSALSRWREATEALLDEGKRPEGTTAANWIQSQIDRRSTLLSCLQEQTLIGSVSLVFGELRLRDLSVDLVPAGVGVAALQGWEGLTKNARDAVRESLGMLQRGKTPYLVMTCAEPALEVIVRKLVDLHLDRFRGNDLAPMLYSLLEHAKTNNDQDLEAVASIGLGLRLLRNRVSHDAERSYDRHEAAFFLNGLSLMLQAVA